MTQLEPKIQWGLYYFVETLVGDGLSVDAVALYSIYSHLGIEKKTERKEKES